MPALLPNILDYYIMENLLNIKYVITLLLFYIRYGIIPEVKCRRILRRINFHLQGGRRRRSGATSMDDNAANGNLGK